MPKDITHIEAVIIQMREIQESIERLNERYNLLKETVITELAGDTEGLIGEQPVVTYATVNSRRFDTTAFKEAMPEVYESFRKPQTSVRFQLVRETRNAE